MESQRVLGAYKERFRKELPKMNMIAGLVEFLSVFSMFSIQFKNGILEFHLWLQVCKVATRWQWSLKADSIAKNLPRGSGGTFLIRQDRNLLRSTYSYSKSTAMKTPLAQYMEVKCGLSFTFTLQWKINGCHQMAADSGMRPPLRACSSFFLFVLNCRLITLQYCSDFCHTLTWISHGCRASSS